MSSEITEFVKDSIYPNLDAVSEGFLDDLNPKKSGDSYICDCPECGKSKKAYYYPRSGYVVCNRQNNCGKSTSIWDCLLDKGYSNFDALKAMASAVGVDLPNDESEGEKNIAEKIKATLKYSLSKSSHGLSYMKDVRGWSQEEIDSAPFGYIHSMEYFLSDLRKKGIKDEVLNEWGFTKAFEKGAEFGFEYSMDKRIVGWWETPDGKLKLWGRDVTGKRKDKYRYQDELIKDMPCYWNEKINKENRNSLIFVEGPIDASRLITNNIPSVAIGGASISSGMSVFLSERISLYLHWIDNDLAGHLGAGTSITKTNPFGIYSTIFFSPIDDVKDADEALGKMEADLLIELIDEHSVGCGEFIANGFIKALGSEGVDTHAVFSRARFYNAKLQGVAKSEFMGVMQEANILLDNPTATALRALAELIDSGLPESQARRIIRNRFELNITIGSN